MATEAIDDPMKAVTSKRVDRSSASVRYSICTMVSNWAEHQEMIDSFVAAGFSDDVAEYLHVDNSAGNTLDAFEACNVFLSEASGQLIILCHQDVVLLDDGAAHLEILLAELDGKDPNWGVCGNAGMTADGAPVTRITHPAGADVSEGGPFPRRVVGLDENFLIVPRRANLALSHDLQGFHLYGADLCAIADILGLNAWVIDFHLHHKSPGTLNASYWAGRKAFTAKYRRALRPRWMHITTRFPMFLSGSSTRSLIMRASRKLSLFRFRKRPNA